MSLKQFLFGTLSVCLGLSFANAQSTVTTDPVGFTTTSCLSNSDTYLGIPFMRPPEFTGTVQLVTGGVLTVNGTPGWTTNQFVYAQGTQPKHYYVLVGNRGASNPKEGHIYSVTGNDAGSLTLDTSFDNLTGIVAGTKLTLIPYWTPGTIFPASDAGVSYTATTTPPTYQTEILVPSKSSAGINQPPAATYFFISSGSNVGWRLVSDNNTDHTDDPLLPESYLVVRNANGAPTLPLTALGSVLMSKVSVPLLTQTSQQQDNPLAMVRPVDSTLDSNGLAPIDTSFVAGDQLLLFDNTQQQIGKQPSKVYTFADGWRLSTDSLDHSKDVIPAGTAMIVRKATARTGQSVFWGNTATYVPSTVIMPLAAGSRKAHAAAGSFDVNMPAMNGTGIECRRTSGASNSHQIVFTFANLVTISGATVASLTGGAVAQSGSPVISGNHITVNLTNVSNAQRLAVTMSGVSDGVVTNDVTVPVGVLLGDVNSSRRTDNGDAIVVRNASGSIPSATGFRADVNTSGRIDNGDAIVIRNASGTALP